MKVLKRIGFSLGLLPSFWRHDNMLGLILQINNPWTLAMCYKALYFLDKTWDFWPQCDQKRKPARLHSHKSLRAFYREVPKGTSLKAVNTDMEFTTFLKKLGSAANYRGYQDGIVNAFSHPNLSINWKLFHSCNVAGLFFEAELVF